MKEIKKIHIIGMGALGLLYGNIILDKKENYLVQYVMDQNRYQKNQGQFIKTNGIEKSYPLICDEEAAPCDLLIVAVKSTGLPAAIESIKNSIDKNTIIISVMNGIDSEQLIGERYGFENIIYCVAQGMDAMKLGNDFSYVHAGELRIGGTSKTNPEALIRIKTFFDRVGIAYTEEEDIITRIWSKFMLNVGTNQVCMAYQQNYRGILTEGEPNRVMIAAMREVIAVANAAGVPLSEQDLNHYITIISRLNPSGMPSMAQDRINRKYSEVESFAGTVIHLAEQYGIYVPSNRYLYKLVKEIEAAY